MKKIRYILTALALMLLAQTATEAQTLRFVRTDVDSSRSKFVTATYIFGFDIYADSVDYCSNVTFELRYNKTAFIRFSEWEAGNFGPTTESYVLPLIDEATDFGRIVVSCGMDGSPDTSSPRNPKVIHLEFAVIPASPHFETVTFSVYNPKATVWKDSTVQVVNLSSEPIDYTIHSFVNAWPGDADNNGVVDHLDFATVSYYLGMGPNTKQMRSFRREPASTLWAPQSVIAWDTAAATYADCDGNGEVNMTDNLVVTYNYDNTHPVAGIQTNKYDFMHSGSANATLSKKITVPIYAESNKEYLAATGYISDEQFGDFTLASIVPYGTLADDKDAFAFYKNSDGGVDFIVGTLNKTTKINGSSIIGALVFESNSFGGTLNAPRIDNFNAISRFGEIFPLNGFTSVAETISSELSVAVETDNLIVSNPTGKHLNQIKIYNINGEEVLIEEINSSSAQQILPINIPNGFYIVRIIADSEAYIHKLVK